MIFAGKHAQECKDVSYVCLVCFDLGTAVKTKLATFYKYAGNTMYGSYIVCASRAAFRADIVFGIYAINHFLGGFRHR